MHFGDVTSLRKEFRVWNEYLVDDRIFVSARLMTDEIRPKTLHADKVRSNAEICGISWIGRYFLEEIDRLATINKLSQHGILRIDSQMFVKRGREERETCLFN